MIIRSFDNLEPARVYSAVREGVLPFIFTEGGLTYIGCDPIAVVRTCNGKTLVDIKGARSTEAEDPFAAAKELLKEFGNNKGKDKEGPFPFSGGMVGYFSYDLREYPGQRPGTSAGPTATGREGEPGEPGKTGIPDAIVGLYDPVIVVEHAAGKTHLVTHGTDGYKERAGRLTSLLELAASKPPAPANDNAVPGAAGSAPESNLTRQEYIRLVEKAKDYIEEGDIYQINISMRFTIEWGGDPFALYSAIRRERPSRYGAFIDCGDFQIILNSPERLLKLSDGVVETEPIKGTRPRGKNASEDRRLVKELRESKKERAEHVMIVDLERNDLGRISKAGTVRVTDFERIETLPGLHHMVSTVLGEIREPLTAPECLKSIFPGGSITGAPKLRAINIIDELEPTPRGVYTGAVGWIDLAGGMDTAMAIRTALYKDGALYLSVGSGIVADSEPSAEYDETLLKAEDFLRALSLNVAEERK